MLEKPSFGEIRKDIINNKKEAESKVDSEESWTQYDSPLWQIGASFEKVLPEKYIGPIHKNLDTHLNNILKTLYPKKMAKN